MRPLAADSFRLSREARGQSGAAEDIVLAFGREGAPGEADEPPAVELLEEIVLSPATAARLLEILRAALRECRPLPGAAPAKPASLESVLGQPSTLRSSRAEAQAGGQGAARLFSLVGGLRVPYRHERSFRMKPGALQANRFLLSLDLARIVGDRARVVSRLVRSLEMPHEYVDAALASTPQARALHLGFEGDGARFVYKLYFELATEHQDAVGDEGGRLLHRAFKWEAERAGEAAGRRVETRYVVFPELDASAIDERIVKLYANAGADAEASLEVARALLGLALSRGEASDLEYLEVHEAGNPRRSFDLNLYDVGLSMKDLHPHLGRLRRRYGIAPSRFQAFYDQISSRQAGHVAGGIHREGEDFFTFYYAAEAMRER